MGDILSTAVIEVIRHLCETQQEDKVWLQNYLLAACDTIAALRAENEQMRKLLTRVQLEASAGTILGLKIRKVLEEEATGG